MSVLSPLLAPAFLWLLSVVFGGDGVGAGMDFFQGGHCGYLVWLSPGVG